MNQEKYTLENFIVGDSNKFAYSSAKEIICNPGNLHNPLYIYGNNGLGKTHLMKSIENELTKNNLRVIYITTDEFMKEFINIKTEEELTKFREKYTNIDALLIDDIQFLNNAEKTSEELLNIFDIIVNKEKQVIITSNCSIEELKVDEKLKNKFNYGLKAEIHEPEREEKIKIINEKIKNTEIENKLDEESINLIASTSNDIRTIEGALTRLIACKLINKIDNFDIFITSESLKEYFNI